MPWTGGRRMKLLAASLASKVCPERDGQSRPAVNRESAEALFG
jgi:hypothetical protein